MLYLRLCSATSTLIHGLLLALLWGSAITAQAADNTAYGPVKPGQSIWQIARDVRPNDSLTLYQTMLGLLSTNPQAFAYPCNLNSLKGGATLAVPPLATFQAIAAEAAKQSYTDQAAQWDMRKQQPIDCANSAYMPEMSPLPAEDPSTSSVASTHLETPAAPQADAQLSAPAPSTTESIAVPTSGNQDTQVMHFGHDVVVIEEQQYIADPDEKPTADMLDTLIGNEPVDNNQTAGEAAPDERLTQPARNTAATSASSSTATDGAVTSNPTTEPAASAAQVSNTAKAPIETSAASQTGDSALDENALLMMLLAVLVLAGVIYLLMRKFSAKSLPQTLQESPQPVLESAIQEADAKLERRRGRREEDCPDDGISIADVADRPLAWLIVMILPIALFWYLKSVGLPREAAMFVGIASIALIMWMFSLVSDFIPALLLILLLLLFGLAPSEVILSGFASNGFLLAFSVLGLGAVITASGITKRYTLMLIKHLPPHTFWYQVALFFTGLLFTPIVPAIGGRASIVAPILKSIVKGCDEKSRKKASTMLYTTSLDGINYLSAIFLTSAPANFMIFGMLPTQEQQAFQFIYWMYAASLSGLVMLVLYFVLSAIFFRAYTRVEIDTSYIEEELNKMGKMSLHEWLAIGGVFLLALGIATSSIHKIKIPVIAFCVLMSLLFIGVLKRDDFIKRIDWAFLFLLASLIGVLATMNYLGIDQMLTAKLGWLGNYMRHDFPLFVLILTGVILAVRMFIPLNSAILIFATALIPIATVSGVNPWMIGFIILVIAETAFFAYQSPYMLFYNNLLGGEVDYNERQVQIFRVLLVFAKLAAIYISLKFWASLGIL